MAFFRVTPRPVTTFCSKEVRSPKLWQLNRRAHVPVPSRLEALVLLPSTEHRNWFARYVWHFWNEENNINHPVKNMCKTTCLFFAWKTLPKKKTCVKSGDGAPFTLFTSFSHMRICMNTSFAIFTIIWHTYYSCDEPSPSNSRVKPGSSECHHWKWQWSQTSSELSRPLAYMHTLQIN